MALVEFGIEAFFFPRRSVGLGVVVWAAAFDSFGKRGRLVVMRRRMMRVKVAISFPPRETQCRVQEEEVVGTIFDFVRLDYHSFDETPAESVLVSRMCGWRLLTR